MQIAEEWQLPPFRLGMCTAEDTTRRVSKLGAHRANPGRASRWRAKARPQAQSRPLKAAPPGR